jgi:hypothetical protein
MLLSYSATLVTGLLYRLISMILVYKQVASEYHIAMSINGCGWLIL